MKKIVNAFLSALAVVGLATAAGAATNNELQGSDTLEGFTNALLTRCQNAGFGVGSLIYIGGGSGRGQTELVAGRQVVAPMSRFLNTGVCGSPIQNTAGCTTVGRDGVAIYLPSTCPNCDTNPKAAQDISTNLSRLQLIYGGNGGTGATAACNAAARLNLANTWANVVDNEAGNCANGGCALYHAYRRDDLSGTTETFQGIVGVAAFCNGLANAAFVEDKDPVRRTCKSTDTVCSSDGTRGLVVPILVPPNVDAVGNPVNIYSGATACTTGEFRLAPAHEFVDSAGFAFFSCPELAPQKSIGGFCFAPTRASGANRLFDCINGPNNNGPTAPDLFGDSRLYNRYIRQANGTLITRTSPGSNYRLKGGCTEQSATAQISCFAGSDTCQANATPLKCANCPNTGFSIGFSGVEFQSNSRPTAGVASGNGGLAQALCPTVGNAGTVAAGTYVIGRNLYVCSADDPTSVVNGSGAANERALMQCIRDRTDLINQSITAVDLVVSPNAGAFTERAAGGVACP